MRALAIAGCLLLAGCKTLAGGYQAAAETTLITSCKRFMAAASTLDQELDALSDEELIRFSSLDRIAIRRCTTEQSDPLTAAAVVDAATADVLEMTP